MTTCGKCGAQYGYKQELVNPKPPPFYMPRDPCPRCGSDEPAVIKLNTDPFLEDEFGPMPEAVQEFLADASERERLKRIAREWD